jgi:hypothetical protein
MSTFVEFKSKDKKSDKSYVFNRSNINYFRNWVVDGNSIHTSIYLKGSDRPVVVPIKTDEVKKILQTEGELESIIDNMNLTEKRELLEYLKKE